MIFLARLGAVEAFLGFCLGVWLWRSLTKPQRLLTGFLGLSGVLGFVAAALRVLGYHNAWVGNLWELVILCALFQSLLLRCCVDTRNVAKFTQLFMLFAWVTYYLIDGKWGEFSSGFHVSVCITGSVLAGWVIIKAHGNKSATLLAWAVLVSFLVDVLPHSASQHWLGMGNIAPKLLWTYRNAVWCITYLLMGYSLTLWDEYEN